jgi:phosphatidylglycerophosphate synthase
MVESIRDLRKICQKKYKDFGRGYPIWEFLDRKISIHFTKLFLLAGISANQATFISTLVGISASYFLAVGPNWFPIIAGLLFRLWSVLDCTDGEIARYNKTMSVKGEYIDRLSNTVVEPLIFVALTFRVYSIFGDFIVLILGFFASIASLQIKLAIYNIYASVLNVFFNSEKSTKQLKKLSVSKSKDVLPHWRGHSSLFYGIVQNFLPAGFIMLTMILVVAIIDFFVPSFIISGYAVNFSYLFLIVYGIFLPLGFLGLMFVFIKSNSPKKILQSLISHS